MKYSAQKTKDGTVKTFISVFEHADLDVVLSWVKNNIEKGTQISLTILEKGQ